jgi:hypothetical protein
VLLGIIQAIGHGILMPRMLHTKYSPGALTAALLHLPIGINYLSALRAQGPIGRDNWIKSVVVLFLFFVFGVATPNIRGADKHSPHAFTAHQMGPYGSETPQVPAPTAPEANG